MKSVIKAFAGVTGRSHEELEALIDARCCPGRCRGARPTIAPRANANKVRVYRHELVRCHRPPQQRVDHVGEGRERGRQKDVGHDVRCTRFFAHRHSPAAASGSRAANGLGATTGAEK